MAQPSLVFLLLHLPRSPVRLHLWLSGYTGISSLQRRVKRRECLPWSEALMRELSWAFLLLHRHPLHRPLLRTSMNSKGINNILELSEKQQEQQRLTFLDVRAAFLGFATSPSSSFFGEARFFLGFASSFAPSSASGLRAVSGTSLSATWPSSQASRILS